jgi:hypothetical protein
MVIDEKRESDEEKASVGDQPHMLLGTYNSCEDSDRNSLPGNEDTVLPRWSNSLIDQYQSKKRIEILEVRVVKFVMF